MGKEGIRIILASDQPQIRRNLLRMVEQKLGGTVVGEGENAINAVRLARRLRPDVAIIDSYLPYSFGLSGVSLSRNSGLDAAQAISSEIPGVQVVLVNNLSMDSAYPTDGEPVLMRESIPVTGENLMQSDVRPGTVTFANLETSPLPQTKGSFSDRCEILGMCGLLIGLVLTATMFLAYIGLPIIGISAVSLLIGIAGNLFGSTPHYEERLGNNKLRDHDR